MSTLVKHFIKNPKIYLEIQKFELEQSEKNNLTDLVTLLYHQKLLNKFLEQLEEEDKKVFLELVLLSSDENYLEFLHQKIVNLEEVVVEAIGEIEEQILEDFRELIKEN